MARQPFVFKLALALVVGLLGASLQAPRPTAAAEDFAFGVIVDTTDVRSMRMAREAGFSHAKMVMYWAAVQPSPGYFLWDSTSENDFDNLLKAARAEEMALVVRVDGVPGWAGGSPAGANLDAVREFYENAARHAAGGVTAFEILNEPNLPHEWGGPPSPSGYTAFLKAAYEGVKAGDPSALVIGGGPSPSTGGFGGTIEDFDFLNGMYDAGAKGFMDVLAVHNYGGNSEPERDPRNCGGICFRRAELYREVMVRRGDARTPVWMTEWGYLMDPGVGLGQYDWMKVSVEQQADYLVRAHRYALANWPWMTGSLISNLDASTSPYHTGPEDGLPWFAIINSDYSPRPAWYALQTMRAGMAGARKPQPKPDADQSVAQATPPAEPSADLTTTPEERVRVTGTAGDGVNLRSAPSASATRIKTLPEGAVLIAIGGPREAEGRSWRNVRDTAGTTGWIAAEYATAV